MLGPESVALINRLLKEERRSIRSLAKGTGFSLGTVSRILDGRTANPRWDFVVLALRELGYRVTITRGA
jgi:hypothetical protein